MDNQCILVAQVIGTEWSKRSRGAPGATLRNAVPERLALPAHVGSLRASSLVHIVVYGERNEFQSPVGERLNSFADIPSPIHGAVGMVRQGDTVQVQFQGPIPEGPYVDQDQHPAVRAGFMGIPMRAVRRRPFVLRPGEWGEIRYMGRYHGWYEPWYEKWVYNIGWFPGVSTRVFLDTEPQYRFESMPDVW